MKVLQASEEYFITLGLIFPDSKRWSVIKAYLTNFIFLFFMGPFLCGTCATYVYYNSHDLIGSMNAVMLTVGSFMCSSKYLSLRLSTDTLKVVLESFQRFADQGL